MGIKKILIPFNGLKEGEHGFEFKVDDVFFGQFENSEIKSGQLAINVDLTKRSTHLELTIKLQGKVKIECDRCLDFFDLPISYNGKLYVKFGDEDIGENDDLLIISRHAYEIDLSQYMYENIHLSLPVKRMHPDNEKGESGCNPEMMAKLNDHIIEEEIEEKTDPRWDKLKDIIKNN